MTETACGGEGGDNMETRIALIGIIVEDREASAQINTILHEYAEYVVGRMGIPYRDKNVNVISVVLDAPNDIINSVSGKLGMIPGIGVKTIYAKANG